MEKKNKESFFQKFSCCSNKEKRISKGNKINKSQKYELKKEDDSES